MSKFVEDEDFEELEPLDRGDDLEDEELDEEDLEDDEDLDDEDLEEEEEEEEPPKKEPKIPKSRLDEVIQQREEAKERALWLESQLEKLISQSQTQQPKIPEQPVSTYDFAKAEEEYVGLIIDGEIAKASKLRSEIDKARREEMMVIISGVKESVASQAKAEGSALLEDERFNTMIINFESKYKFLDTSSKDYNEEAVETVNTLLAGYVSAGKSKSEALSLAVKKVAPLYSNEVEKKQTLGNARKVAAGKKAVEASKSQPPKARTTANSSKSVDLETLDIKKMSDREFNKLTAKELKILRGD